MIDYSNPDFKRLPILEGVRYRIESEVRVEHTDVSVITPYYNTESIFLETASTVLNQSLQNWEWIIVDDGSTDPASIDRLAEVASGDVRIKVVRQANAGPAAARNTAFRNSKGRYVCLLDSDDLIEPTYLEKCVWFLDSNPEFAFCNSYSVVFGDQECLLTAGFERGVAHLQANSGPPISVIRRTSFEDSGGFDESIRFGHEDWDFWLAMAESGHWGYTIREYLQWYRKRGNGRFEQIMSTGGVNEKFEDLMRKRYEGLASCFPEPARRHPMPYEKVESDVVVSNPLSGNDNGRRIMFLVPWMVTGGADRVNLDLIEGLIANGHDVTVCATLMTDHQWEHEFSRLTPDVFVLPNFLHISDFPRFLSYLITSRKIDTVVVTGSTLGYQFLPYLRATSPDVAFVDMCHVEEPHWQNGGHPRFGAGYQDLLDLNITTTSHLSKWMEEAGADRSRIRVMYTGVRTGPIEVTTRDRIRDELGIPSDMPVIVFAGRICEQKRPLMLAEILNGLQQLGLRFRALIIGDGELRPQLEQLIVDYQLSPYVSMLGSVVHGRWLEILAASDVLLMPSKYEGISVAVLEAISAGVVPVVAKVGGQDEIVAADAGVLIDHGDSELFEYVNALRRLLGSPQVLETMSKRCKALAKSKLSWDGMISNFEHILDEAHELRLINPKNQITKGLGRELVTQAIECKRLGDAVEWLWNSPRHVAPNTHAESANSSEDALAAARLAIAICQTRFGQKLIRNGVLRKIGRFAIRRLGN